jgi:type I restriction enzyme, S subunit
VKAGWDTGTLVSVSTNFTDGDWIETKDQSESGIRLVQTGNVGVGEFKDRRDKARFINEATFRRLKCFQVLPNDCLISRLPDPVGRGCLIPETGDKMITAVDCSVVRIDDTQMLPDFYLYYLQSNEYFKLVEADCSGTTRKRISRKKLEVIPIPIPPLKEQKRIVAILDAAFERLARAADHAETNLQNARELFKRSLSNAFDDNVTGWKTVSLGDAFKTSTGNTPSKKEKALYGRACPFVKPPELLNTEIGKTADGLSLQGASIARIAPNGAILVSCIGILGKVGIATTNVAFNQQINAIFPDGSKALSEFMFYQALSAQFRSQLNELAGGTTVPIVNKSRFNSIKIALPPLGTQEQQVSKLREIDVETKSLRKIYRTKLTDIADLRQSLLQKAFAGELT